MLTNYLKIALRNIRKQKFYSFINILGLTIGIASSIFIGLYILDELSYDHFHTKGEQIYRMNLHGKIGGQEIHTTATCGPMAESLVTEIPEVSEATRLWSRGESVFRYEDKIFSEDNVMAADSNFFDVFSFGLIAGNPKTALLEPNSIVLTKSVAEKYFGENNGLDKSLEIGNDKTAYKVTGIMNDVPGNSHIDFGALYSMSTFDFPNSGQWLGNGFATYYVLAEGASPTDVDEKFIPIVETNVSPALQEFMNKSFKDFEDEGGIYTYFSIPLYDIHLKSDLQDEPTPQGDMSYVMIMGAIGIFILLIASINFMNLSTAKSASRAKEVGLRKTLGSLRFHLIRQFLVESLVYVLIAALMALVLVYLLLPAFNMLSGKTIVAASLLHTYMLSGITGMILIVGLLAGSYPAFYLTSFKITEVLKGKVKAGMKSGGVRSFLVTFQFWVSIVLIICTSIVYKQLKFVQTKNLGIAKEQIMVVKNTRSLADDRNAYRNAIISQTGIVSASYSNNAIPGVNNTTLFRSAASDNDHIMATYFADENHQKTLGFEMVKGRYFSEDFPSDSLAVVINESAVRELGWTDPLNERLVTFNGNEPVTMQVIGVAKDFNFESLKSIVRPLVLVLTDRGNVMTVRFEGGATENVIKTAEEEWNKIAESEPFEYSFLDDDFDALFRAEQRLGRVFTTFTVLAIFIACLGLFGLAAYSAEQRGKEIGIRKVMGASVWSISKSLSSEFTKLVGLAFLLAIYPSYYLMNVWLADFANRIEISPMVFAVAGFVALLIAVLTVSYQSLKAASTNPVNVLRSE
jgi:putative ABC transport system permease protein